MKDMQKIQKEIESMLISPTVPKEALIKRRELDKLTAEQMKKKNGLFKEK